MLFVSCLWFLCLFVGNYSEGYRSNYQVTNLLGQVLMEGVFNAEPGLNTFKLPFNNLMTGVYLLKVEGKMMKLIKN